jgi:hypothetical protein
VGKVQGLMEAVVALGRSQEVAHNRPDMVGGSEAGNVVAVVGLMKEGSSLVGM